MHDVLNSWLNTDESTLDGVYLQFEKCMLNDDGSNGSGNTGKEILQNLTKSKTVGVWGHARRDPDNIQTATELMNIGLKYVNTDLPKSFTTGRNY